MTRIKVIPNRGLRLREPVLWAASAAAAMLVLWRLFEHINALFVLSHEFILFLAALLSFPLTDALTHRTYKRVTRRAAVFGFSFGLFFLVFLTFNSARDFFGLSLTYSFAREIALLLAGLTLVAILAAATITFALNRVLGRHVVNDGALCWHCAYSTTGLEKQTRCPECGNDFSETPPAWRARRAARRTLIALACLAIAAQLAHSAHVLVTQSIPHLRFRSLIPPSEPAANIAYGPPGDRAGMWRGDALTRTIDITERARELRVDGTHLSATWLFRPDLGGVRVQFDVCIARYEGFSNGRSMYSSISPVVWNLRDDDLQRFKDTGGLTPARIDELLITADRARYRTGGLGSQGPRSIRTTTPHQRWLFRDTEWPAGDDTP